MQIFICSILLCKKYFDFLRNLASANWAIFDARSGRARLTAAHVATRNKANLFGTVSFKKKTFKKQQQK
jgi:hypothetical protein